MKLKLKKIMTVLLAAIMCLCCTESTIFAKKTQKVKVTSVQYAKPKFGTVTIKKGNSYKLKCTVKPTNASDKKLTYKSSNPKIVKVNKNGKLTALKKGKAVVTIKSRSNKNKKKKITVIVGTPVSKVTVSEKEIIIKKGKTKNLSKLYKITPDLASNKNVVFTSSNKKIASVTKKGKLTAKSAGKCKIKITAKDGHNKYASITVQVVAKFQPAETLEEANSESELFTPSDQMLITAYGMYDNDTNSIDISWSSLTKTGTFTVQKQDGSAYMDLTTVTDTDSYSYPLNGFEHEQMTFRILQHTDEGTAASNAVTMQYNEVGTDKFSYEATDSDKDGLYDYMENQLKTDPY